MKKLVLTLTLFLPMMNAYGKDHNFYCTDDDYSRRCRERKQGGLFKCVCPANSDLTEEASLSEKEAMGEDNFHMKSDFELPLNFKCSDRYVTWDIGMHQYSVNQSVFLEAKVSSKRECMNWVLSVLEEYEMEPARGELDISGSETRYVTADTACTTNRRTGETSCHKTGTYSTTTVYQRKFKCKFHGLNFKAEMNGEFYSRS